MKSLKTIFLAALMTMCLVGAKAEASRVCEDFQSCAEASIEKNGYVTSDCEKVKNDAQDQCAAYSIVKNGYVTSDCLKVANNRQDRCAAASIEKNGYVTSSCLNLP